MDIKKTKLYYEQINSSDICDCAYCKNYVREIKSTYPKLAKYLGSLGVDIEKPFETMPLEPDEKTGRIEYISAQYIVYGGTDDFSKKVIGCVNVDIAETHPPTQINEAHFVIEIYPISLRWVV